MRCADRRGQGAVSDLQGSDPMHHGQGDDVVTGGDLRGDLRQDVRRGGVTLVVQPLDNSAVIVIAHVS